jgi:hypothetical protein
MYSYEAWQIPLASDCFGRCSEMREPGFKSDATSRTKSQCLLSRGIVEIGRAVECQSKLPPRRRECHPVNMKP